MKDRISCLVLLALCRLNQAEPTAFPTLDPSASPAPTPVGRTRRLKGTRSKGMGPGSSSNALIDGTTDEHLQSLLPGEISETHSSEGHAQDPNPPALSPFLKPSVPTAGTVVPGSLPSSTSYPTLAAPDYPSEWPSISPTLGQTFTPPSIILQSTDEPTLAPSLGPSSVPSLELSSTPLSTAGTAVPSSISSSTSYPSPAASDYPSESPSTSPTLGQTLTPPSIILQSTNEPTLAFSRGPSSVPSLASSSEPSNLPSIIDFGIQYCNLEATVDCRLEDGSSCSSLSAVSSTQTAECIGRPYELEWLYIAGSCSGSTGDASFECRDENGGPSSVFMAYLTIKGLTSNEEYYSSFIFQGINGFPVQRIILKDEIEPYTKLDAKIYVVVSKGSPSGKILQEMIIPIACNDGNKLLVGDSFGALQLASYHYEETSSIQAFEEVRWIYTIKNAGNTASVLKTLGAGTSREDVTAISPKAVMLKNVAQLRTIHSASS